jgi:hypothetical protein
LKTTAEDCLKLSVFDLKRFRCLGGTCNTGISWTYPSGGKSSIGIVVDMGDGPCVRFGYTLTRNGQKIPCDYSVDLDRTACHFGGVRYWFVCPGCSRRVGVLYLALGWDEFRCRHCLGLVYESQTYRGWDGGYYPAFERLMKLERTVKRYFWRGRLTRKYRKLLVLDNRVNRLSKTLISFLDRQTKRN